MLVTQEFPEINVSFHPKSIKDRKCINSSCSVYQVLMEIWDRDTLCLYEEFKVLFLDRKNGIIGYRNLNRGTISATVVDIKLLFCIAIKIGCSSIVISHNHPSGNINPSTQDNALTSKISKAAKLLDIKLLDHLIVTESSYYSYCDEGIID